MVYPSGSPGAFAEDGAPALDLAALAGMVDGAVRFGDRGRAVVLAERLLEELSRHYRSMRPLRLRCAPHVGAALADETLALIGDVEHVAMSSTTHGDGAPGSGPDLRRRVERLVAHEAAEMTALAPHRP